MKKLEKQAKDSLSQLVAYVFKHQDGSIRGITYEDLALRIERMTKHGKGHAHGMGKVLGEMGHLLQGLEGEWGEPIPYIQSLVVKKTGVGRGLPADGIEEFWEDYPKLTRAEKEVRTRAEYQKIAEFGSRWNDVLVRLNLPLPTAIQKAIKNRKYPGKGGESASHKKLKEHVRSHPSIVGAGADWESFVEYTLPSLDAVDIVFKSATACIAVEVKAAISDTYIADYERGLYQTIKYRALLTAMSQVGGFKIPSRIRSVLVLESALPPRYRTTAHELGVEVIENVFGVK